MAFDYALRIQRDAAFADQLLHSVRVARLDERERPIAAKLLKGMLRRRGELDHLIGNRLRKPVASLDLEVLTALRLGAYQLRHMNGVTDYAAVSQSVELVKRARKRSAASLVNAVLRNLPPAPPAIECAQLSHPAWLVDRWQARFGRKRCDALLLSNLRQPASYLRIPRPAEESAVLQDLHRGGLRTEPTGTPRAYRLRTGSARNAMSASRDGIVRVQDLNSQRVALLLAPEPHSLALDLCAAPGGKARLLAESCRVVATDRQPHRVRLMRTLGARGVQLALLDAEHPLPFTRRFDRVLVDAPCSGTGTLARHPEIKWRLQPSDLGDLRRRQEKILGNALEALAAGGLLVYATCSLEPEENADVVGAVMRHRPRWHATRALLTVPGTDPGEGFEAWRIRRPED